MKEALEAHEWDAGGGDDLSDELGTESEDGFGTEAALMERDMMGLKMGMSDQEEDGPEDGGDEDVEKLEDMLSRMRAIKDMGPDVPAIERRRFAAKAVREVMKT